MATTDARAAAGSPVAFGAPSRIRIELDFAKMKANGEIPITGASGDIIQLFNVYKKDIVEEIFAQVVTVEGGTLTVDIGDYTTGMVEVDADGYHDGLDGNVAALSKSGGAYTGGRKAYVADNIVALLLNNAADAAVIIVEAVVNRAQN